LRRGTADRPEHGRMTDPPSSSCPTPRPAATPDPIEQRRDARPLARFLVGQPGPFARPCLLAVTVRPGNLNSCPQRLLFGSRPRSVARCLAAAHRVALSAHPRKYAPIRTPPHPRWLRCSSLAYRQGTRRSSRPCPRGAVTFSVVAVRAGASAKDAGVVVGWPKYYWVRETGVCSRTRRGLDSFVIWRSNDRRERTVSRTRVRMPRPAQERRRGG